MSDHSYARVADFLPFDAVVPLRHGSGFYERQLSFVAKPSLTGPGYRGNLDDLIPVRGFPGFILKELIKTLAPPKSFVLIPSPPNLALKNLTLTLSQYPH